MRRKSIKKWMKSLLAVTIAGAVTVGGTLAVLKTVTETKVNVFASVREISIQLREPKWDGYQFTDNETTNGESAKPGVESDKLGITRAASYVPGEDILKNPQVKNSSEDLSVYAGIKVEYFKTEGNTEIQIDYTEFDDTYLDKNGIAFNSNWIKISKEGSTADLYMYANAILPGADTSENPLFDSIPVNPGLEPDENGVMPKFKIKVTAYAIQADYVENPQEELGKFVSDQ